MMYLSDPPSAAAGRASIPAQLNRLDFLRRRDYRENLRFYYGLQWPYQRINQKRRRLVFNYAKTIIEKVTSYLMTGLTIAVDPEDDSDEAKARARATEALLQRVYAEQDLALLDFDTELDCAILGDAAYKVTWVGGDREQGTGNRNFPHPSPLPRGEGTDPSPSFPQDWGREGRGERGPAPGQPAGRVRITAPDVTGLYVWWMPDDLSQVWRVATQYALDNAQISDLYGLVMDEKQPSQKVTEVWTAATFELYIGARLLEQKPNPYGFIPLVIYPNLRKPHQFWGESDITNIKESVIELNRAFSQLSAILEVSGNPIAVLEGVNAAEDIAVEPGAVWEIPSEAKAYLLDLLAHGGMDVHLKYIDMLYRTLHDLGESPRTAFGGSASPNIAALAMQLDLDPIIKKVRRKQLIRTVAYKKRAELILRLYDLYGPSPAEWLAQRGLRTQDSGLSGRESSLLSPESSALGPRWWPAKIRIVWSPVMPQDRARDAEINALLVDRGILARRTAAISAGVDDAEAELRRWLEENASIAVAGGLLQKPEPINFRNALEPQ